MNTRKQVEITESIKVQVTANIESWVLAERLCEAAENGQADEVRKLWQQQLDLRETVAAIEPHPQVTLASIDKIIAKTQPVLDRWLEKMDAEQ